MLENLKNMDIIIGIFVSKTLEKIIGGPHPAIIIASLYTRIIIKASNLFSKLNHQSELAFYLNELEKSIEKAEEIGKKFNATIPSNPKMPYITIDVINNPKEFTKKVNTFIESCKYIIEYLTPFADEKQRFFKRIESEINTIESTLNGIKVAHPFVASLIKINLDRITIIKETSLINLRSTVYKTKRILDSYKKVLNNASYDNA